MVVSQKGKAAIHWFNRQISDSLPYLDVDALSNNNITQFVDWYSTIQVDESDICVLWDGGRNGLILKGKKGALGSTLYGLTPLAVDSNYLFYYLKSKEELRKDTRHVDNTFWEMEIPIPPIEEQKSIAQSIQATYQNFEAQNKEAEKDLLDSFRKLVPIQSENLEKIEGLEDFKKAVLDLAVSGKLLNHSKYIVVKIEKISAKIQYGFTTKALQQNTGIKFLRITDIQNSKVEWTKVPFCKISEHLVNDYLLTKDDILFARIGATVGKSFIIEDELDKCIFASYLIRVQLKKSVNAKYIYLFFQSTEYWKQIKTLQDTTTLPVVNGSKLANINVALPSLEEQTEIVRIVETIFAEADKIQQDFELQKKQQDDLLKSVINAFFQYSDFPIAQIDWDLDAQIKVAREKKEKELAELKKKQKTFQKTLFNFGNMKKDDKDRIKKKIKEVTHKNFASFEVLTEREIELLRESVKGSSNKSYTDEDFAAVFLEMTQDNFEGEEPPFFESEIINGDTLAFKFQK